MWSCLKDLVSQISIELGIQRYSLERWDGYSELQRLLQFGGLHKPVCCFEAAPGIVGLTVMIVQLDGRGDSLCQNRVSVKNGVNQSRDKNA